MKYEKTDPKSGQIYTWVQGESLAELARPERVAQIKADYEKKMKQCTAFSKDATLGDVLLNDGEEKGCLICHL